MHLIQLLLPLWTMQETHLPAPFWRASRRNCCSVLEGSAPIPAPAKGVRTLEYNELRDCKFKPLDTCNPKKAMTPVESGHGCVSEAAETLAPAGRERLVAIDRIGFEQAHAHNRAEGCNVIDFPRPRFVATASGGIGVDDKRAHLDHNAEPRRTIELLVVRLALLPRRPL